MAGIRALIVVYNRFLGDCEAFNSLKDIAGIDLIVADNSTQKFGNSEIADNAGCGYISFGENIGLSRAYNRVIADLNTHSDGIICLFDDDTTVFPEYFTSLAKAEAANPGCDVFIPLIRDGKGLMSPCIINGARVKRIHSLEHLPAEGVTAINSGMALRLRAFRSRRYDEGQFLDYIDHAFIRDLTGYKSSSMVILKDVTLQQRFSGTGAVNRRDAKYRFNIFRRDLRYFGRKHGIPLWNWGSVLLRRRLKLMLCGIW